MVYLTYIIDNYDNLPDNVLFIHASRYAWHNDDPDYDSLPTLRNFRFEYLQEQGYVNLRCTWDVGCPAEIFPWDDASDEEVEDELSAKEVYKAAFEELVPDLPVPEAVAVSCCAQFGVTRETIQARPREDYVGYRQWLTDTSLSDDRSGRIFEYGWHIIFGREAVHCPDAGTCYCNVWGLCNLTCTSEDCGWYGPQRLARSSDISPRLGGFEAQRQKFRHR
ncbi:hypothetical protein BX600DRAFT_157747 [Xylariales sp. PMI_506]|nr:hypothetical protein BX600DRAFT_157747 [Xylariales sp. PMI_506]